MNPAHSSAKQAARMGGVNLLAYDTSSAKLSVALFKDREKLAGLESAPGVRHSSVLMPMIEQLLKKNSLSPADIDVLAVGLGPGSFTGLRVGIATAKVLGYVLKVKIIGISSLEAMAREAMNGQDTRAAAMMDARKGQVYGAIYEKNGGKIKTILAPSLLTREEFRTRAGGIRIVTGDETLPTASNIARAAIPLAAAKRFMDPYLLEPLYLHPRDCNVTYPK